MRFRREGRCGGGSGRAAPVSTAQMNQGFRRPSFWRSLPGNCGSSPATSPSLVADQSPSFAAIILTGLQVAGSRNSSASSLVLSGTRTRSAGRDRIGIGLLKALGEADPSGHVGALSWYLGHFIANHLQNQAAPVVFVVFFCAVLRRLLPEPPDAPGGGSGARRLNRQQPGYGYLRLRAVVGRPGQRASSDHQSDGTGSGTSSGAILRK